MQRLKNRSSRPIECRGRWILVAALLALAAGGCDRSPSPVASPPADTVDQSGTVELSLEFNGRAEDRTLEVEWKPGDTVYSVMIRARDAGRLTFAAAGAGETVFVKAIADVENEGAGGDNWVFRINDQLGNSSCGVVTVAANDRITWRLGSYP